MTRHDAIVVGGGVVGCAIAYSLGREGLSVALLERADLAIHASGVAAGMLAPFEEAEDDGPLLRLGLESLNLFEEFVAEVREGSGVDPEFARSGLLRATDSAEEAKALRKKARTFASYDVTWVDAKAARAREPHLARGVQGALWSPLEAHVRGTLLTRACARAAEGLGVEIECGTNVVGLLREGARVVGVRTPDGDRAAGHVILATGAWAGEVGSWLGLERALPVTPVRGQILALEAPRTLLHSIVWGPGVYLVPRRDGSIVVGATEERVGFECRVTADGIRSLLEQAIRLVPPLGAASFRGAWAGLRPDTPDHLPAIGAMPGLEGLVLAVGHHRNGVLLAPVTGRLVADLVLGKGLSPDYAEALRPERFFAGEA